jgi:hypothetical protein
MSEVSSNPFIMFINKPLFILFCDHLSQIANPEITEKCGEATETNLELNAKILGIIGSALAEKKQIIEDSSIRYTPTLQKICLNLFADNFFQNYIPDYCKSVENLKDGKKDFFIWIEGKITGKIKGGSSIGDIVLERIVNNEPNYRQIAVNFLTDIKETLINTKVFHGKKVFLLSYWENGFFLDKIKLPKCDAIAVISP